MNKDLSVLYVEDDARSRKVMKMLLRTRMGLQHVTIFDDSIDFLSRVKALRPRPNVIFLDIHVQPYNGFQMLKMLKGIEGFSNVPVVALTASVMNEEIEQLREAGFHGCLAKPIDSDTFPDMVDRIVKGESIWRILM